MERFYTALNRFDAYLLLHRLQHAGISAHVFNEHVSSIVGEVPPDVAQPQVWLANATGRGPRRCSQRWRASAGNRAAYSAAPVTRKIRPTSSFAGTAARAFSACAGARCERLRLEPGMMPAARLRAARAHAPRRPHH